MATSRHLARGLRVALAAAFTALLVGALPGVAHADPAGTPQTSDEATAQIEKLTEQAGTVTEQYNVANIKLGKYRREVAQAKSDLAKVNRRIGELNGQVKTIATSAYKNGHLSSFSAFMTSKSPQSFLDQLSALDMIASKQSSVLRGLDAAKVSAQKTRERAEKAAAGAEHTAAELNNKKASILKRIAQLKELKSQLTAQERAALVAREGSTDPNQVRQEVDSTDTTMAAAAPSSNASGKAAIAVRAAEAQIGKPYAWGAAGPDAFDCSGLMVYAWAQAGISLPHSSAMQAALPHQVSESELQPGDLVGYYSPVHHVAMYVGNGMVINAPDFGESVKYAPLNSMPFTSASRPY